MCLYTSSLSTNLSILPKGVKLVCAKSKASVLPKKPTIDKQGKHDRLPKMSYLFFSPFPGADKLNKMKAQEIKMQFLIFLQ